VYFNGSIDDVRIYNKALTDDEIMTIISTSTTTTTTSTTTTTIPDCIGLTLGPGDYNRSLIHQDLNRTYYVHVPQSYDPTNARPLVLNLHGGGSNGKEQAFSSKMKQKSDSAGFIVVHPDATHWSPLVRRWNCGPHADQEDIDDVGFISAMLDSLEEEFCIDTDKIYSTGISSGGFMSYRLACELSNRIAAVAPVAAMLDFNCSPSRAVPIIHFHGTDDVYAPYEGGNSSVVDYDFMSVNETIEWWIDWNNCTGEVEITYNESDDNSTVICETYSQCSSNVEIILCTIYGGGHTWPGGVKAGQTWDPAFPGWPSMGYVTSAISANDEMWDFFMQHPMLECKKGDSDCDGTISDFELLDYIDKWAQGLVEDFDLLEAIDNWAKG